MFFDDIRSSLNIRYFLCTSYFKDKLFHEEHIKEIQVIHIDIKYYKLPMLRVFLKYIIYCLGNSLPSIWG